MKKKRKNIIVSIQLFFECHSLEVSKEVINVESNQKRRRRESIFSIFSISIFSFSFFSSIDASLKKRNKKKISKLIAFRKKFRSSVINRQKIRALKTKKLNLENDRHELILMKRWLCDYIDCSNQNHHCYQSFDENDKHYKLYNDHIFSWNASISASDAIVDSLSLELKSRLYLMKNKKKKIDKKRDLKLNADQSSSATSIQSSSATSIQSSSVTSIQSSHMHAISTNITLLAIFLSYNFQHYSSSFYQSIMSSIMHSYQQSSMHLSYQQVYQFSQSSLSSSSSSSSSSQSTNKSTSETPTIDRIFLSSSVRIDDDVDDLIQEFIYWQISKNFQRKNILMKVKNKLHNEMFELKNIHSINDDVWSKLQISIELRRRLKRDVKFFRSIVKQNRKRLSSKSAHSFSYFSHRLRSSLDDLVDAALLNEQM